MILDTKLALEKANGNQELAKELFQMLISDLPISLNNINSCYHSNLYQDLLNHTHRLHGSTAYCGTSDLKVAVSKLENSIKQNNADNIKLHLKLVESSIIQLIEQAPVLLANNWS